AGPVDQGGDQHPDVPAHDRRHGHQRRRHPRRHAGRGSRPADLRGNPGRRQRREDQERNERRRRRGICAREHRTNVVNQALSESAGEAPATISPSAIADSSSARTLDTLALLFLTALCILPILAERRPVEFVRPYQSAIITWHVKLLVVATTIVAFV